MLQSMIERFQIEDLISQDLFGVVFRALDTQSGKPVAVRRFFPFGADGGGLDAEEQTAYEIAVDRLAGLKHPALRSVVCGACDPVDRMPFIVTEWIEGEPLAAFIAENAFPAESAILLITQALEVCELFSHVLAEEAIWIETNLQSIIVSSPESVRGFTFWISPLKWLGSSQETRGLEAIAILGEQAMGWTGHIYSEQSGGGLGGWLKWLRRNATATTLQEARASLAALVGAEPPPPVALLVANASELPTWKAPSKAPLIVSLALGVVVVVLVIVFVVTRDSSPGSARQPVTLQWNDHEAIVANNNNQVNVEGTAESIDNSDSGKTIYLVFSSMDQNAARAGIRIGKSSKGVMIQKLEPFVGKKIRVSGEVVVSNLPELNRPDIMMKNISAVEIIK